MVKTRGQQLQEQQQQQHKPKTEAIPGEEDSTMARWPPPPPPAQHRKWRGPRGGRGKNEAVDWAELPDSCVLRVFELLNAEKANQAVSGTGWSWGKQQQQGSSTVPPWLGCNSSCFPALPAAA